MIFISKLFSGACRVITLTSVNTVFVTDKSSTLGKLGILYLRQGCTLCMVAQRRHYTTRLIQVRRNVKPVDCATSSLSQLKGQSLGRKYATSQIAHQRDAHQKGNLQQSEGESLTPTEGVPSVTSQQNHSKQPEASQQSPKTVSNSLQGSASADKETSERIFDPAAKATLSSDLGNLSSSKSRHPKASSTGKSKSKKTAPLSDKTISKQKEVKSTKPRKGKTKPTKASLSTSSEEKATAGNRGTKDGNQACQQITSSTGDIVKIPTEITQPRARSKAKSVKRNQGNKTGNQTASNLRDSASSKDGQLRSQQSSENASPTLNESGAERLTFSLPEKISSTNSSVDLVENKSSAIADKTSAISNKPHHALTIDEQTSPDSSKLRTGAAQDIGADSWQPSSTDNVVSSPRTIELLEKKGSMHLPGVVAKEGDGKVKPGKERRRWTNVDSPQAYLQPFMDVSIFCGMTEEAQKLFDSARLHNQELNTGHYNTMLQAWARKGNLSQVRALFSQMVASKLTPDLQSYAAALECMGRMKDINHKTVTKCLDQMKVDELTVEDIFQKCTFTIDQREVILSLLEDVQPGFKAPPPLQRPQCNVGIVKELYTKGRVPHLGKQSPCPEIMSQDEMLKKLDEQMKMEKSETVLIPSIEKEMSNNQSKKAILEQHKQEWREALTRSFKYELKKLRRANNLRRATVGKTNFYPFFSIMDPHEYVNLMLDALHELANSTEGNMTVLLSRELGYRVQRKYLIRRKIKMGVADKVLKLYKEFVSRSLNVKALNHRELWKSLEDSMPEGPSLDADVENWPANITLGIGSRLAEMMIREIKINTNMSFTNKPEKMIPALYHMYTYRGFKQVGYIKPHPSLVELLQHVKGIEMPFDSNLLPMISPPIPWCSVKFGAFPLSTTKIMRCKDGTPQHQSLLQKTKSAELYPVLDSLNQLASTPWIINKPILDVIINVFQKGGSPELDIAQPPSVVEPIPKPTGELTQNDLVKIQQQRALLRKKQAEMHSLRMDALYKFSIADKYRNEIFWFPHNMDFRGRVYPCPPHFNHMGSDVTRSILMFAEGLPLGPAGLDWLKIHLVNLTGHKKRCSLPERLAYANEILPEIKDSAEKPLEGKGWWKGAEDKWQALACCIEIINALKLPDPSGFISHLPVHQDGSCNGLQHYAALGRDVIGSHQVNLCPTDVPQDVYSGVAQMVEEICKRDAENGVPQAKLLTGHIQRKVVKQTVMTVVYGVTMYGGKWQIHKQLSEVPSEVRLYAAGYLARNVFKSLREMFTKTREIQDWLTDCAWLISKAGQTVEWVTPLGLPVIQPYHKKNMKVINHADHVMYHTDRSNTDELPDTMKQKNAFPPNFIHSLDSTHMMLTSLNCHHEGIAYASVHDCFWTHAASINVMNRICREQFVRLHSEPILNNLAEFMMEKYGDLTISQGAKVQKENPQLKVIGDYIKQVPEKGDFDLKNVLKSTFFFS
ncbi:DNA-directed RNA polymerase, mitochondrial-like [Asterias amurensis]|uniref:DNA-directed RNA polymerase, mitochondrial-like n=1 Tax=Asterias amurensis TaxID=7602 RepID=UPI003AB256AE